MRHRVAAWAVALSIAAGCSAGPGASPSPVVTVAPTATPAATEPFPLSAGKLAAGRHRTSAFQPTLSFELGDGWSGMFADEAIELAILGPGEAFFGIQRTGQVVDPVKGTATPAPDDLIAWLGAHPDLTAEAPEAVTIAGIAGQRIDVVGSKTGDVEIFAFPAGNLRIPAGVTFRVHVLALDGADLTIVVGAPTETFQATTELVQPILDSLEIEASH